MRCAPEGPAAAVRQVTEPDEAAAASDRAGLPADREFHGRVLSLPRKRTALVPLAGAVSPVCHLSSR
jgi:hypothetical protein